MKKIIMTFLLTAACAALHAQTTPQSAPQTAQELETLLETQAVSYAQAARIVLEASEARAGVDQDDAFRFAVEREWLPKNTAPEDAARLNGIALLLMRSFDLKGGVFFSLFKSPHHAYRELVYKGFIRGYTDPFMPVSGRELLLIISRILSVKEKAAEAQI